LQPVCDLKRAQVLSRCLADCKRPYESTGLKWRVTVLVDLKKTERENVGYTNLV